MKRSIILAFSLFLCCCSGSQTISKEAKQKLKAIKAHEEAVYLKDGWIRDPYIVIGPDNSYYLTGTTPMADDPREQSDPYNTGLGDTSIVGHSLRIWKSDDLVNWEYIGSPYDTKNTPKFAGKADSIDWSRQRLWAPELHWVKDRWALVHCPSAVSELAITDGAEFDGNWTFPNSKLFNKRHDPSLFLDNDGQLYMLWTQGMNKFYIAPIKSDYSGFASDPVQISPSDRRIGHEGATMYHIGDKYVFVGTAWSTDQGRHGSYNLYYCTSDSPYGPFSERRFMGRFLGHGTPFQDKDGNWWCTAFYNGNVLPLDDEGIETRDLSETAQTINEIGTTIVPLDVEILSDGDVYMIAKDPRYGTIGPDEVDKAKLEKIKAEMEAKLK